MMRGCMTAMVTPFDSRHRVDYRAIRRLVEFQIGASVSGLVPLGTTGESPTVSDEERRRIIGAVVDAAAGKVPVIAGTGSNSTEKTIHYTREAERLGSDAALIVAPYYNKPSQEGIYRHFKAVSAASRLPVIVYNIAGRTGVNIETATLARIARLDNVIGVKEASGSITQMMDVISSVPPEFTVLSGDDSFAMPLISLGGCGVISVASNLLPRRMVEMTDAVLSGETGKARRLHYELLPLFKAAFIEPNPAPIKAAMALSGMYVGGVRSPLCEMEQRNLVRPRKVLSRYPELGKGRAGARRSDKV